MKDKKIGIPRALYYYYFGSLYQTFFEELGFSVVISPETNVEILDLGEQCATDEMCLSMKIFLGHIAYLQDKCDYIVVPRIDNYGVSEQTCTNFLALFDIVHSLFPAKILNYNIDLEKNQDQFKGFLHMGRILNCDEIKVMEAYEKAEEKVEREKRKKMHLNARKLKEKNLKILVVSHPYNSYDAMVGKPIFSFLEKMGVTLLYSDQFDAKRTSYYSKIISRDLYFKFSKEILGSIPLVEKKIDGILFLSSFPCALDSISYELAMRKIHKPYLHLVLDDLGAGAGIETRLESFVDILEQKNYAG